MVATAEARTMHEKRGYAARAGKRTFPAASRRKTGGESEVHLIAVALRWFNDLSVCLKISSYDVEFKI